MDEEVLNLECGLKRERERERKDDLFNFSMKRVIQIGTIDHFFELHLELRPFLLQYLRDFYIDE